LSVTNIFIDRKAQKQLDKLPKNIQDKICDAIRYFTAKEVSKNGAIQILL
jgi:mRNA-degrading endonuclease RelE of RelBE toxin-antitoxin system